MPWLFSWAKYVTKRWPPWCSALTPRTTVAKSTWSQKKEQTNNEQHIARGNVWQRTMERTDLWNSLRYLWSVCCVPLRIVSSRARTTLSKSVVHLLVPSLPPKKNMDVCGPILSKYQTNATHKNATPGANHWFWTHPLSVELKSWREP